MRVMTLTRPWHRLRWLPAALVLLVSATAGAGTPEHGILWRIQHDGQPVGHLFGTIHSDRPEVLDLPAAVTRVFDNAERYVFEVDQREIDRRRVARMMHYTDGGSLGQTLPPELWPRVRRAASERGLPSQAIASMEPWAAATVLSLPPTDPRRVLDMVLQRRARSLGRPVSGLETVAEQLSIFDRLGEERQIEMLAAAVEMIERGEAEPFFDETVRAWLARDLGRIVELADDHPAIPDPAANDRLMDELLERRNRRMAERMQTALGAGGAFVAVGALHLPGEDGLIRLLERRGYSLEPVY